MKFPFFASFIVFIVWLSYEIKKHKRFDKDAEATFWERESLANNTRKKSLENLAYITIPIDILRFDACRSDEAIASYYDTLLTLSERTIVNLTGFSNTDLKLEYGTANITVLTEYDENYTLMARTLHRLAESLYRNGFRTEARYILEFAVSTVTDVSGTYQLLARIYQEDGHPEKVGELIAAARQIKGLMKNSIVRTLQESCQQNDLLRS